jgi:hypothetical protein
MTSSSDVGGFTATVGSGGAGGNAGCVAGTADDDFDKDGYTEKQGDCNDCDKGVNPDAVEVIAEPENGMTPPSVDEDCDGEKDNVLLPCDEGLVINSADPMDAVKAIGLCKFVKEREMDGGRREPAAGRRAEPHEFPSGPRHPR